MFRAKELLSGYISIEKCRTDLNERITQNFKQLTGYKTQIRTLKKNLYVLDERIKNVYKLHILKHSLSD